jgi:hypothetical protein
MRAVSYPKADRYRLGWIRPRQNGGNDQTDLSYQSYRSLVNNDEVPVSLSRRDCSADGVDERLRP